MGRPLKKLQKRVRTNLTLAPDVKAEAASRCDKTGESLSEMVERLLSSEIGRQTEEEWKYADLMRRTTELEARFLREVKK